MKKYTNYIKNRGIVALVMLMATLPSYIAFAFPAERYATESVLASGNWTKIKVNSSGMQFVSNAQLNSMGFNDPTKVNVYGFGGRMISENLDNSHPDDLPLLPVVRTAGGILFFGVDPMLWQPSGLSMQYSHTIQPYGEESYYFLSDRAVDGAEMESVDLSAVAGLEGADSFIERLVHEKDIFAPGVSGRNLLGEDLRGAQVLLDFPLTGNIGGDAWLNIRFGSNLTNSSGTVKLTSTNAKLSQNSVTLDPFNGTEQFMSVKSAQINATNCGETLQLALSFSSSGVINMARLDYVEVQYERALQMPADQLYFYFKEENDIAAVLKGVTSETEIWDVTVAHNPKKVKFTADGSSAKFKVGAGYHEFVAFNPSRVNRAVENAGAVVTQNIHGMESPELLIISPEEYLQPSERLAAMHRQQDNMTVHVLTPQQIYNEFSSGTPDVSAFRKLMKMWYDRDIETTGNQTLKYCLIMSRPSYDNKMATPTVKNAGYPRVPIWQSPTGYTENTSYSTDDFIGMLEDYEPFWDMGSAKINVAVGRFPVRSLEEANAAVDKLLSYTNDPGRASWRNNVMLIADDQNSGAHLSQSEDMYANMMKSNKGGHYQYERLYLDNYERQLTSVGLEYPEAKKRMFSKFEEGQALVTYIGHANTVSWTHEHLLNWGDITSFSNTKLPVLYAATCEFARWDADDYSGGEVMWAFPKTGVIAMICPSRSVYIDNNGRISAQFGHYALTRNEDGTPTRLGDAFVNSKNNVPAKDNYNKLRFALLGDPAMKMPVYSYTVEPQSIYDVDVTGEEVTLPVIEARSTPRIKGVITDHEGNPVADFNGVVYMKLYDSEKSFETLGNGEEGKVMYYEDRKTKLYEGATKVENGEWDMTVYMPMEIENNYRPGRMTFYAVADDGREANGATDRFYVYGYDSNAPEDNQGPEILKFVLNHDNFQDGDLSYKTPVVFASFSDESGINISDAGIGHQLMLTLDDKTVFTDVIDFYMPDLEDNRTGSFTYQLPEIEAGHHSLTLSVWDHANNSSYATINFNVAAVKEPDIYDIGTAFKADGQGVDFVITSDRPLAALSCNMEVFDINGVRIWHKTTDERTDAGSSLRISWDFVTAAGNRVNKGIYICRATVTTPEGKVANKSKKIVVTK